MARKKSPAEREVSTTRVVTQTGATNQTKGEARKVVQAGKERGTRTVGANLGVDTDAKKQRRASADARADMESMGWVKTSTKAAVAKTMGSTAAPERRVSTPPVQYREASSKETANLLGNAAAFKTGGPNREKARKAVGRSLQMGLHNIADDVDLPCQTPNCDNTVKWGDGDVICPGCEQRGDQAGKTYTDSTDVVASTGGAGGRHAKGTGRGGKG